jgi:hypothetical protein
MRQINLSARGYQRVLGRDPAGVCYRAIADRAGRENMQAAQKTEALQYHTKLIMP